MKPASRFSALSLLILACIGLLATGCPSKVLNKRPFVPTSVSTQPEPGQKYLQFMAVGDFGDVPAMSGGKPNGRKAVADAMVKLAGRETPKFVLVLGDNFYQSGVKSASDSQFRTKFEDVYTDPVWQSVNFFVVLGNHDHRGNPDAQVEYARSHPDSKWKMPARYYTWKETIEASTEIQFFALDTNPLCGHPEGKRATQQEINDQLAWLERELKKANEANVRWKIVFGHHPRYSGGMHGSDDSPHMKKLEALFKDYNVDVFLTGHDHDVQLIQVNGVHYIVSGGGAEGRNVDMQKDQIIKDHLIYAGTSCGFTAFRASKEKIYCQFYSGTAENQLPNPLDGPDYGFSISK